MLEQIQLPLLLPLVCFLQSCWNHEVISPRGHVQISPLVPRTRRSTCGFSGDESHSKKVRQQVPGLKVQIFTLCLDDMSEKMGRVLDIAAEPVSSV